MARAGADGIAGRSCAPVDYVVLTRLIGLAVDPKTADEVRAIATNEVEDLKKYLTSNPSDRYAVNLIAAFERDPKSVELPKPVELPPGQPIGEGN